MQATIQNAIERKRRINYVEQAIRNALKESLMIDYEALCILICEEFNCAMRTAKEYIKIARHRIDG